MSRPGRNARQVRARIKRRIMPWTAPEARYIPAILEKLARAFRRDETTRAA